MFRHRAWPAMVVLAAAELLQGLPLEARQLVLSEVFLGTQDYVTLLNRGTAPVDLDGHVVRIRNSAQSAIDVELPSGLLAAGAAISVVEVPSGEADIDAGTNLFWTKELDISIGLVSPCEEVLDFVALGSTVYEPPPGITFSPGAFDVSGIDEGSQSVRGVAFTGASPSFFASDWAVTATSGPAGGTLSPAPAPRPAPLTLTEVYVGSNDFVTLRNRGEAAVNLDGFVLRIRNSDQAPLDLVLPSGLLEGGADISVVENPSPGFDIDAGVNLVWLSSIDLSIALTRPDCEVLDFVALGSVVYEPPPGVAFVPAAFDMSGIDSDLESIRRVAFTGANPSYQQSDWTVGSVAGPAQGTLTPPTLFAEDFESGDLSSWSARTPLQPF